MTHTQEKADELARRVLDLAKATILSENHFLSAAVGRLATVSLSAFGAGNLSVESGNATRARNDALIRCDISENNLFASDDTALPYRSAQDNSVRYDSLAVDGSFLYYSASAILKEYQTAKMPPTHDVLHAVMHCVFLHPYVGASINQPLWDLASDLAAERAALECCGIRPGERGLSIQAILHRIEIDLGCRPTAEKMYHRLCEGKWAHEVPRWSDLFHADNHLFWYAFEKNEEEDDTSRSKTEKGQGDGEGHGGSRNARNERDNRQNASAGDAAPGKHAQDSRENVHDEAISSDDESAHGQNAAQKNTPRAQGSAAGDAQLAYETAQRGNELRQIAAARKTPDESAWRRPAQSAAEQRRRQEEWRGVAASLAVNLQTFAKKRGQDLSGLVDDLNQAAHRRVDYAAFLRQFATFGEVMHISQDEFDYIFYTYGLHLYGNVPLIEPLEYREEKRIREFVLVIDTSGSVQGETVRSFVTTTFDILKSTESFHRKVHVHILQADAQVRSDEVITSSEELAHWTAHATISGGGGTDFRPAFEYVNALVADGTFTDLGGLVYFTDGWGTYPEKMPEYRVAFVFYDENYRPESVPPWAAQVVLDGDTLDEERKRYEHTAGN